MTTTVSNALDRPTVAEHPEPYAAGSTRKGIRRTHLGSSGGTTCATVARLARARQSAAASVACTEKTSGKLKTKYAGQQRSSHALAGIGAC